MKNGSAIVMGRWYIATYNSISSGLLAYKFVNNDALCKCSVKINYLVSYYTDILN